MNRLPVTPAIASHGVARVALAIPAICTAAAALLWTIPNHASAQPPPPNLTRLVQVVNAPDAPADPPPEDREPRIADPAACSAAAGCIPILPPADPFGRRSLPFTLEDLEYAIAAVDWPVSERAQLIRIITTCENVAMDAGIISYSGEAYGAAQVILGWFDQAHIPRESWPSITANIRAARAARDDAVARGLPPFIYWSCR